MKQKLSLVLALLMLLPAFTACAESKENTEETSAPTVTPGAEETVEEVKEENPYYEGYVDPFVDVDFDGDTFMVYNSINDAAVTLPSSNFLIEGPEELTGEAAGDAALERNAAVSEMLNINMEFTQVNFQLTMGKKTTPLQKVEYTCQEGLNQYKTTFAIFGFLSIIDSISEVT